AIGPVLLVLGSLATGVSSVITIFGKLGPVITKLGPILKGIRVAIAALSGPIGIVIAIVTTLAIVIWRNWDDIKEWTINAFNTVKDFLADVWEKIKDIFFSAIDWIDEKTDGKFLEIVKIIKEYMEMVWENIKAVWDFIKDTFQNTLDFLK